MWVGGWIIVHITKILAALANTMRSNFNHNSNTNTNGTSLKWGVNHIDPIWKDPRTTDMKNRG